MSDIDELYTDLTSDPEECQNNRANQRAAQLKRLNPSGQWREKPRKVFQNASMPDRLVSIRKFSWEAE